MRINSNINFKGTFYTTSDSHTRLPMTAGVLTEIENRAKDKKEPVFLLDCGDFFGDTFPLKEMSEIYLNFHKNNPKINFVFNLGNVELEECLIKNNPKKEKYLKIFKNFSDEGIKLVNATACKTFRDLDKIKGIIEPYITLEDVVDNEKKKILITGFTQRRIPYEEDINDTKEILKGLIKPAIEKENPNEIILMMHTMTNYTKDILDYVKNELGIENIKLVTGGHPHSIEDFTHGETRILYPAPNGKCAYEIEHTKNGFEFPKLTFLNSHYNYAPLSKNPSVIVNTDISNPLPVNPCYSKSINSIKNMSAHIAKSMHTFKARDEYNFTYSSPSELGTFMANSVKKATNSDIGLMLTQDFREKLPKEGNNITRYNIYDVVNVDKNICQLKDVTVSDLKQIFEISLEKQNEGERNSDFFEYSSNIKIDRRITDENNKVKQIYIKENNEWVELLDENGNPKDKNKKYTVATSEFVAQGGRPALRYFKNLKYEYYKDLKTREMVSESLRNLEKNPQEEYETSIMEDV